MNVTVIYYVTNLRKGERSREKMNVFSVESTIRGTQKLLIYLNSNQKIKIEEIEMKIRLMKGREGEKLKDNLPK